MKREKIMLAKDWKFYLGDQVAAYYKGFDDSAWKTVCVPHDWAVEQPFSKENSSGTGYLPGGVGWYRTHFVLPEKTNGKKVVLNFGGVYNNSQVWCNSNNLGKRPNGYSSFAYDITEFVQPGDNVISVCVRHEHTADSRWYTGSGIYRPTYLEIMDACCFTRHGVFISTKNADKKSALLQVEWSTNASSVCAEFNLLDEHGNVVFCGLEQEGKTAIVTVPSPDLWSPDSPKLYTLRARLLCDTKCCDEIEIPFGIRTFQFDAENGFFLNNIPMKLKGVCLHHDAGVLGAAVPQNVWRRRLQKLKEMGCNAIRTSHNPPDVALLDLCDSMGFLVMDEAFDEWEGCKNKWWQGHNVYPPKRFGYAADFPVWHEADLQEMVCRDRNHPSIILWSIGNEIDYPNDPYCSPLFQTTTGNNDKNKPAAERQYDPNKPDAKRLGSIARELYAIVKQYDTTRPVTAAIAFPEISNQVGYTDALDVVGYNYKEHLYEQDCATYKNRVIYGSENGHTVQAWTAVKEHQNICGQFLWTGVDYMGEAMGWPLRVATPGLLTMAGFEKPKYYHRKAMWTNTLFAKLATRKATEQGNENELQQKETFGWNYELGELTQVICYSNAQQVELFLNQQSLGTQTRDWKEEGRFVWNIPFEPGILEVCAKTEGSSAQDILRTAGEPHTLQVNVYQEKDDQEVVQIELRLIDALGVRVTQNDCNIEWKIENGEFLGLESGAPDDLIPYTSRVRKTFHGEMIGYARKQHKTKILNVTLSMESGNKVEIQV